MDNKEAAKLVISRWVNDSYHHALKRDPSPEHLEILHTVTEALAEKNIGSTDSKKLMERHFARRDFFEKNSIAPGHLIKLVQGEAKPSHLKYELEQAAILNGVYKKEARSLVLAAIGKNKFPGKIAIDHMTHAVEIGRGSVPPVSAATLIKNYLEEGHPFEGKFFNEFIEELKGPNRKKSTICL